MAQPQTLNRSEGVRVHTRLEIANREQCYQMDFQDLRLAPSCLGRTGWARYADSYQPYSTIRFVDYLDRYKRHTAYRRILI